MPVAIISGVTGQDGAYLARLLLLKNYNVVGLVSSEKVPDTFRLAYLQIKDKVNLQKINLLNVKEIETLLEEFRPDEFYNLAAISSVGHSFIHPHTTFDFNTRSVINILESIRKVTPTAKFYQASSSEMFGNVGEVRLPIKESFLFHPASPYGISKAAAHWITVNYREAYKLNACCGILFNHESALRPKGFVIKKVIQTAIRIKRGTEKKLTLGNTSIIRDWGYAPMYVEAMWRMMQQEKLADYLICSGNPISLRDFVDIVFSRLNLDIKEHVTVDQSLLRSLDLEMIYGDNSKARNELKWEYELSPVELIKKLIADELDFMEWASSLSVESI